MSGILFHGVRRILCLGAHSDDIEIGCGGTLLRLAAMNPQIEVCWEVFSATEERAVEARQSVEALLGSVVREIRVHAFRECYFPSEWPAIKDHFGKIRQRFEPDLIFTHHRNDRHQDHRVLSDLAWNTFRRHLILEYETPKYDGDVGQPNVYMPLPDEVADRKVAILLRHFITQTSKHWFTEDLFRGVMRLRGMECGSHYAEAFHGHKLVFPVH